MPILNREQRLLSYANPSKAALRRFLMAQERGQILSMLNEALEYLPAETLPAVFGGYFYCSPLWDGVTEDKDLLEEVRAFDAQSRAGAFYEETDIGADHDLMSKGAENWIVNCNRLLAHSVDAVNAGQNVRSRLAMDILFELLDVIDVDPEAIIYFADEPGSWQVGVDWGTILPAWFKALAAEEPAATYWSLVQEKIEAVISFDEEAWLEMAAQVARKAGLEVPG